MKIEQWTEHHYPSFLTISSSGSGTAQTAVDPNSRDARALMYSSMAKDMAAKAEAEKMEALMADLRAKGIIKARTPEQIAEFEKKRLESANEAVPWKLIMGMIAGVIAAMGLMGWGIVWLILKYADVSR